MTAQLRESYAGLERKVEERTAELQRVARVPDRDRRDPARHQQLADRCPAGVRRDRARARRGFATRASPRFQLVRRRIDSRIGSARRHAIRRASEAISPQFPVRDRAESVVGRAMLERPDRPCPDCWPTDPSIRSSRWPSRPAFAARSGCRCCARDESSAPSRRRARGRPVHRQADRAAQDLRRPGGDRDRERAPVQRDRRRRSSSRPRQPRSCASSAARRPTCSRCSTRSCRARARLCDAQDRDVCSAVDGERLRLPSRPRRTRRSPEPAWRAADRQRPSAGSRGLERAHRATSHDLRRRAGRSGVHDARRTRWRTAATAPMLWRAAAARGRRAIGAIVVAPDRRCAVHRQADRAAQDLRRPGGDRDRERAPVQRAQPSELRSSSRRRPRRS